MARLRRMCKCVLIIIVLLTSICAVYAQTTPDSDIHQKLEEIEKYTRTANNMVS